LLGRTLVALTVGLSACGHASRAAQVAVVVGDSAKWECGGNGGWFGILRTAIGNIDSIELGFGAVVVPGGVIVEPVRGGRDDANEILVCPTEPVLVRGATVQPLAGLLPFFKRTLPAMAAIDSSILYWAIVEDRVYAARHSFQTGKTDTTFLVQDADLLATDNMYQLLPPRSVGATRIFETWPGQRFKLDSGMRLIGHDSIVR
jgi:hypothetical protein